MQNTLHLDQAIQIATEAHDGQTDKTGAPFFDHCRRVASSVSGEEEKIVAYLHDVLEKSSGWTQDRLKEEGFSPRVIAAVDALTRRLGEEDEAFVRRGASNALARPVKHADLEDNLAQAEQIGADTTKYDEGLALLLQLETAEEHL